ncbi:hypothetical protein R6Q59_009007 [Mikania micrantha]
MKIFISFHQESCVETIQCQLGVAQASVRDHDRKYLQFRQYTFPSTTTVVVLSCLVGTSWAVVVAAAARRARRRRMDMMVTN